MGRAPCCDKANVKKGPWSPEEDAKLKEFIDKFGTAGNWIALPQKAGLKRCGKSCRLRWLNYLRPNIKHGEFSEEEDRIICSLFANIGSRWSIIAAQLPGRTDNDIKNYWNTKLKKKLIGHMISSNQSKFPPPFLIPHSHSLSSFSHLNTSLYHPQESKTTPMSPPQNFLYTNFNNPPSYPYYRQTPEGFMDLQNYPLKDNMLTFGVAEASSSSDGSCGQISYGKEVKQEEMGFLTGFGLEENPKFVIDDPLGSILDHHKANGLAQLQYDIEEVKQLITAGNGCNNNNLLLFDENKRGERGLGEREGYYY